MGFRLSLALPALIWALPPSRYLRLCRSLNPKLLFKI
jgi:hypothetical protein